LFVVFHGEERMDHHTKEHLHETSPVVWLPLVALAIPSVAIGWLTVGKVLYGDWFDGSIFVRPEHNPLSEAAESFHGPAQFVAHGFEGPTIYLALAAFVTAWFLYLKRPDLPARWQQQFSGLYRVLANKYYFDWFNENVLARGGRLLGGFFWKVGDEMLIDGAVVNGSAKTIGLVASVARNLQSGYLYHYAFAMIVGLAALVGWLVFRT
jgi:NADH-quinone oxidoreductase subunit L